MSFACELPPRVPESRSWWLFAPCLGPPGITLEEALTCPCLGSVPPALGPEEQRAGLQSRAQPHPGLGVAGRRLILPKGHLDSRSLSLGPVLLFSFPWDQEEEEEPTCWSCSAGLDGPILTHAGASQVPVTPFYLSVLRHLDCFPFLVIGYNAEINS